MFTLDSSHSLAHTLFSMFQSGGAIPFNNDRLRPIVVVDEMRNKLIRGYNDVQHAVSRYIPRAALRTPTSELLDLESQYDNYQQATNIGPGPGDALLNPLRNINNQFTIETDDLEVEGGQQAARADHKTHQESLILPKRTRLWMVTFVSGILSTIVVPGLVVGVMTRQMSLGVELSGAIAPIISLLAGLYYHCNR